MIRLVTRIYVHDLDGEEYVSLPMVAASGTLTESVTYGKAGRTVKYSLSFVTPSTLPCLFRNLVVKVILEDGLHVVLGTKDMPVRLELSREQLVRVYATWSR